jgi:hypothetical protein
MHGFAGYDIVRARQAEAAVRATERARHGDALKAWRRGQTLRMRIGLALAPAPAMRPT